MDIIKCVKNGEEVSVIEFLKLDEHVINELFIDDINYTFYEILFNYCIANKTTKESKILYILGHMYRLGRGVERNYEETMKYYKMSAEMGNTYAINSLGNLYYTGEGVEKNYDEAMKYYMISIEKGNSEAMSNVGHMYQIGEGVEKNIDEAIRYYKMAIEKGNCSAMNNIGCIYQLGEGIEKNFRKAIKYYKMAIENGNRNVRNNLSVLVQEINKLTTNEKIEYYKLLNQCEKTKEYAQKIVIKQETSDIVQMHDIIERMSQRLEELETHVRYMPDGIGYHEAKMEFESLC